ncbi:MAG: hypothetical protein COX80_04495 [Candidatus Magasanikbacteria bacterium CG_4_10_14_0_2_um_filter_33_14]|uniref:Uncharacterized protein n=1 Tax=Candidatus Magasanikbacteria bacterium CG_4_10_14_0_2_um_filter_33_14 TaxID=1974636 RepID=A0A2M7V9J7_9BACT|nr:MAG: hypothetical protein COX80_04495 [Candidatus Magasanikbacteria bacterium CG_4_10_14_0_2_um_filter_33_14]
MSERPKVPKDFEDINHLDEIIKPNPELIFLNKEPTLPFNKIDLERAMAKHSDPQIDMGKKILPSMQEKNLKNTIDDKESLLENEDPK